MSRVYVTHHQIWTAVQFLSYQQCMAELDAPSDWSHCKTQLTAIIQSCRLTLFGHIMRMDDNADAKRILLASPPADWRRQLGHPRITWLSTILQDLKQHHLTLPEAADLAQNHPLWRVMLTYGATQCQKRRRRRKHNMLTVARIAAAAGSLLTALYSIKLCYQTASVSK